MFPFNLTESLEITQICPCFWLHPGLVQTCICTLVLKWPLGQLWLLGHPFGLMDSVAPTSDVPLLVLCRGPEIKSQAPLVACNPSLMRLCYGEPVLIPSTSHHRASAYVALFPSPGSCWPLPQPGVFLLFFKLLSNPLPCCNRKCYSGAQESQHVLDSP